MKNKREIKFRQWLENAKNFHYWGFIKEGTFTSPELNSNPHKIALKNSQQFTGLKDKNGKEIYEGDIIRCFYRCHPEDKFEESIMEVGWDIENCRFSWFLSYNEGNLSGAIKDIEVIGNIYENKELLK